MINLYFATLKGSTVTKVTLRSMLMLVCFVQNVVLGF